MRALDSPRLARILRRGAVAAAIVIAPLAVLFAGYGISYADALAYGIVLQAVELTNALLLGIPALITTGLSWSEIRLHTSPSPSSGED